MIVSDKRRWRIAGATSYWRTIPDATSSPEICYDATQERKHQLVLALNGLKRARIPRGHGRVPPRTHAHTRTHKCKFIYTRPFIRADRL